MSETGVNPGQGQESINFLAAYLSRVGVPFSHVPRKNLPSAIAPNLTGVYEAQDDWTNACEDAAEDEQIFLQLMGHPSHQSTKEPNLETHVTVIDHPGRILDTRPKYAGYGRTLAAHKAAEKELALRQSCKASIEGIIADPNISSVQQVVMRAVLRDSYPSNPSQKDPAYYATKAFELIEAAEKKKDQPLVMVRRRFYTPMSVGGNPTRLNMSDLIVADGFELLPQDDELQLVLKGVKRVVFENYGSHRVGTRSGVIGSGRTEQSWDPVEKKRMKVEELDHLDSMNLVSPDQITDSVKSSFPRLAKLVNGQAGEFDELPNFRESYAGFGSNDPFADNGNETGLFVASDVRLDELQPPVEPNSKRFQSNNGFRVGLKDALAVLEAHVNPKTRRISPRMSFLLK